MSNTNMTLKLTGIHHYTKKSVLIYIVLMLTVVNFNEVDITPDQEVNTIIKAKIIPVQKQVRSCFCLEIITPAVVIEAKELENDMPENCCEFEEERGDCENEEDDMPENGWEFEEERGNCENDQTEKETDHENDERNEKQGDDEKSELNEEEKEVYSFEPAELYLEVETEALGTETPSSEVLEDDPLNGDDTEKMGAEDHEPAVKSKKSMKKINEKKEKSDKNDFIPVRKSKRLAKKKTLHKKNVSLFCY